MQNHRDNTISRRVMMRLTAAGVASASLSGWVGLLAELSARAAAGPAA